MEGDILMEVDETSNSEGIVLIHNVLLKLI